MFIIFISMISLFISADIIYMYIFIQIKIASKLNVFNMEAILIVASKFLSYLMSLC